MYFPYYLVFFYLTFSLMYNYFKIDYFRQNKSFYDFLFDYKTVMIVLFIFVAFRANDNGDYSKYLQGVSYIQSFDDVLNISNYPFEIGFRFISLIVNKMNLHEQFVLIFMNFLSMGMIYFFIIKKSKNINFSLFLLFPLLLMYDMHHARSAVAMSAGLIVVLLSFEKKFLLSLLFVIVGYVFHSSSVILIVFPVIVLFKKIGSLKFEKINKPTYKFLFILFLLIITYIVSPFNFAINLFSFVGFERGVRKITAYLANPNWSYSFSVFDPRLAVLILIQISYDYTSFFKEEFDNLLSTINLIALSIIIILRESTIMVMRTYNFFNIFNIVFLPNLIFSTDENIKLVTFINNKNILPEFNFSNNNISLREFLFFSFVFINIVYSIAQIMNMTSYSFFFI